ncbi:MAG: hypothetical protein DRQ46_09615 [Gammaproteobacteria bacterium]|nr:MAG: hypothetical protein DRQ46_09615 [Gammaproteobacteria bacterium]
MTKNDKDQKRELSQAEVALFHVRKTLEQAPEDKLYQVRTRFDGLVNAYKGDAEAQAMLKLLMAEHGLNEKVQMENIHGSIRGNPVSVH